MVIWCVSSWPARAATRYPKRALQKHSVTRDTQQQISLIAVHAHGLPDTFPNAVLEELPKLKPAKLDARTDLTDMPLITIDPADARDHDDAVFAMPDENPKNEGGISLSSRLQMLPTTSDPAQDWTEKRAYG